MKSREEVDLPLLCSTVEVQQKEEGRMCEIVESRKEVCCCEIWIGFGKRKREMRKKWIFVGLSSMEIRDLHERIEWVVSLST